MQPGMDRMNDSSVGITECGVKDQEHRALSKDERKCQWWAGKEVRGHVRTWGPRARQEERALASEGQEHKGQPHLGLGKQQGPGGWCKRRMNMCYTAGLRRCAK